MKYFWRVKRLPYIDELLLKTEWDRIHYDINCSVEDGICISSDTDEDPFDKLDRMIEILSENNIDEFELS